MARSQDGIKIDEALTRRVADLARLELTDEEVRIFTHQLGDILKYVDQLQKVDVSQVEPLTHPLERPDPSQPTSLREDEVVVFSRITAMLKQAPDLENDGENGGFKVPQII